MEAWFEQMGKGYDTKLVSMESGGGDEHLVCSDLVIIAGEWWLAAVRGGSMSGSGDFWL